MVMTNQVPATETTGSVHATASRLGFWCASLMALLAAFSFAIAVATPPISGPFCQSGCVPYPYATVVLYVSHDYIWMYPGILLPPIFVILLACIHSQAYH